MFSHPVLVFSVYDVRDTTIVVRSEGAGIAFTQRTWKTMRDKILSLGDIEDLFRAMGSPITILNLDLLLNAKHAMLVALFM